MRIAWRTVGAIIARVWDAAEQLRPPTGSTACGGSGSTRSPTAAKSKYLTVVVDHDTGNLVWAGEGRSRATLKPFFDQLGPERGAQITHVSADGAGYIEEEVTARCPGAVIGLDPFHVVKWANDALARVRIDAWNESPSARPARPARLSGWARRGQWLPGRDLARGLKGSRFALSKNPENLSDRQRAKLEWIAIADPRLHRAYLLKEALRLIFQMPPRPSRGRDSTDGWPGPADAASPPSSTWPARSASYRDRDPDRDRAPAVQRTHRMASTPGSDSSPVVAFGFHTSQALIALAMLSLGRHRPALPGRT